MRRFIFGGTVEGRELAERYAQAGDEVIVCVASAYGKQLLPKGIICYDSPLDFDAMCALVLRHAPLKLIDATHPFAVVVTRNIKACAKALGIGYVRVTREDDADPAWRHEVTWADDASHAAALLSGTEGPVLLTTGGNTLSIYAAQLDRDRLYARVLPTEKSLAQCAEAGIAPSHIIAMQGPFSPALNGALYDQFAIRHLVSKDSGPAGGVPEKVMPALGRGLHIVVIRRPEEE